MSLAESGTDLREKEGAAIWEGDLGHPESQRETVIRGGVLQNSQVIQMRSRIFWALV